MLHYLCSQLLYGFLNFIKQQMRSVLGEHALILRIKLKVMKLVILLPFVGGGNIIWEIEKYREMAGKED